MNNKRLLRTILAVAIAMLVGPNALAGHLASKPEAYATWESKVDIQLARPEVTFVKPVKPRNPMLLVLFATGDAGWRGASGEVFEHMALQGYYLAAIDSRQIVRPLKHAGRLAKIPEAAAAIEALIVQSRKALGIPESTPVLVTGYSRGANFVVLTAGDETLRHHVGGAIAIALTRETDFLEAPAPNVRPPQVQVDEKGRIQTYPAIALAGSIPFAVIQSKGDGYVPADEARRLFGADTSTRRLYEVDARNHGFGGGREQLLHDLDEAMSWVEATAHGPQARFP
jgi:hypothetical protein